MKVFFCASSAAVLSPNLVLVVKICLFIYYYYNIAGSKINLNFTNSTQFIYIY